MDLRDLLPKTDTVFRIPFYGMSTMENYSVIDKLGEGSFGTVTKCVIRKNTGNLRDPGKLVALKRVIVNDDKDGLPVTAIREVSILKKLHHKNILPLLDVVHQKAEKKANNMSSLHFEVSDFYLVTPYMLCDLSGLLNNPDIHFTEPIVKCFLKQLLQGLDYLHHAKYYHRDLKTANLLIDHNGILKIADFGLARKYTGHAPKSSGGPSEVLAKYTGLVMTRWYRAPELLFGDKKYTTAIDLWGVGCIFAEMFECKPVLPGKTDLDQIYLIFALVGEPSREVYPELPLLPNPHGATFGLYRTGKINERFRRCFSGKDNHGIDLLSRLLCFNPMKRINAEEALRHEYFTTYPYPLEPHELPKFGESHEIDNKRFKMERERRERDKEEANKRKSQWRRSLPSEPRSTAPPAYSAGPRVSFPPGPSQEQGRSHGHTNGHTQSQGNRPQSHHAQGYYSHGRHYGGYERGSHGYGKKDVFINKKLVAKRQYPERRDNREDDKRQRTDGQQATQPHKHSENPDAQQ